MSPANENKQLCNYRKLSKLALAEPHSVQNARCCRSPRLRGISESWAVRPLWSPVADCEAWVTYGALAKIGQ